MSEPVALNDDLRGLARALHRIHAVQFGRYTLKDGRVSPFYVDLRVLIADPDVLRRAAQAMLDRARPLTYDRIAGLPYAGLPIAVAMALEGRVPVIYPRKETKAYGTRRQIEGTYETGDRVLVVDDVITSGGAKIEGIVPLREAGLIVEHVLVLVDRSNDAGVLLREHGLALHSVMRIQQLLESLRDDGVISSAQCEESTAFVRGAGG